MRRSLLFAALVLAVSWPSTAGAADPLRYGFADDAAMAAFPATAPTARDAGFSYARIYLSWAGVARWRPADPRDPNDPAYDWSGVDVNLAPYAGTGIELMAQLWQFPAWANGGQPPNFLPQNPQDFADFVYAAATRYPQITWWLPANEPNSRLYNQPALITAYEPLYLAAYAAVKAANPAARVAAGSLIRNVGIPERDAWVWARQLVADGIPMDAFAIHPYPWWYAPLWDRAPDVRLDLFDMAALGRLVQVPVFVMEFGWSTADVSEQQQAAWLGDAVLVARCTPGLERFTLFGFHDHPTAPGDPPGRWTSYGLLRADGSPKPSLAAVTDAMAAPLDCAALGARLGAPPGWPGASTAPVPPVSPPAPGIGPLEPQSLGSAPDGATPSVPGEPAAILATHATASAVAHGVPARRATLDLRRVRRSLFAVLRLGAPLRAQARVQRQLRPGRLRLVRTIRPLALPAGTRSVRLGTLPRATYRVAVVLRDGSGRVTTLTRVARR